jgi:hypothetical protein
MKIDPEYRRERDRALTILAALAGSIDMKGENLLSERLSGNHYLRQF